MTSFINLLASDVWSEADIVARTEAMVRSEVSAVDERIINRKLQGAMLGQYTLSEAEQHEVEHFARVTQTAQAAGMAARADMALLHRVFALESAIRRLAQPGLEPSESNQSALEQDAAERERASQEIDDASPGAHLWVTLRNPAPKPEPQPKSQQEQHATLEM